MKGRLVWITGFYLRKADYAAGLRKRYIPEHKSLLYIDLCAFVIDEPASSHPLDNFPVIRKTNSHEEVKSAAKIPPPPHAENRTTVGTYVLGVTFALIKRTPFLWNIANFFKKFIVFPGIWSTASVRRLIRKKYKPEHIIDKIAFIINMEWAVEHIEKILHNLNSNEYDLVYINSGELQCRKYLRRHICGIISIEEVIKHKLCYRLAVTTHADHISIEYGIELIAEKMMLIASMLDFDYCKYMVVKNYDFIICANRHQEKQFQKIISNDKLFILGSPRFDDSKNYNEAAKLIITNHVAEGINWDKNTLLWLPTHTEISPFIYFTPMIAKLQNEFNIILKPHIALYREIKNLDAHIRSIIPEIIIIKDINYIELLPAVDFVICDYGGLVFSAIKADKNVLLFNTPNPELLTGNFAPASPANIIRDRIINFYPDEEEKFFAALKDDSIWEKQKEIRRQIRAEFFTENPNPARDIADLCRHIVKGEA